MFSPWDAAQSSPLKTNGRFIVTCSLHIQNKSRNKQEEIMGGWVGGWVDRRTDALSKTSVDFQRGTWRRVPDLQ
jgi:hypothetical protein